MLNFLSLRTFENIERDDKNSLCLTLINIGDKLKLSVLICHLSSCLMKCWTRLFFFFQLVMEFCGAGSITDLVKSKLHIFCSICLRRMYKGYYIRKYFFRALHCGRRLTVPRPKMQCAEQHKDRYDALTICSHKYAVNNVLIFLWTVKRIGTVWILSVASFKHVCRMASINL